MSLASSTSSSSSSSAFASTSSFPSSSSFSSSVASTTTASLDLTTSSFAPPPPTAPSTRTHIPGTFGFDLAPTLPHLPSSEFTHLTSSSSSSSPSPSAAFDSPASSVWPTVFRASTLYLAYATPYPPDPPPALIPPIVRAHNRAPHALAATTEHDGRLVLLALLPPDATPLSALLAPSSPSSAPSFPHAVAIAHALVSHAADSSSACCAPPTIIVAPDASSLTIPPFHFGYDSPPTPIASVVATLLTAALPATTALAPHLSATFGPPASHLVDFLTAPSPDAAAAILTAPARASLVAASLSSILASLAHPRPSLSPPPPLAPSFVPLSTLPTHSPLPLRDYHAPLDGSDLRIFLLASDPSPSAPLPTALRNAAATAAIATRSAATLLKTTTFTGASLADLAAALRVFRPHIVLLYAHSTSTTPPAFLVNASPLPATPTLATIGAACPQLLALVLATCSSAPLTDAPPPSIAHIPFAITADLAPPSAASAAAATSSGHACSLCAPVWVPYLSALVASLASAPASATPLPHAAATAALAASHAARPRIAAAACPPTLLINPAAAHARAALTSTLTLPARPSLTPITLPPVSHPSPASPAAVDAIAASAAGARAGDIQHAVASLEIDLARVVDTVEAAHGVLPHPPALLRIITAAHGLHAALTAADPTVLMRSDLVALTARIHASIFVPATSLVIATHAAAPAAALSTALAATTHALAAAALPDAAAASAATHLLLANRFSSSSAAFAALHVDLLLARAATLAAAATPATYATTTRPAALILATASTVILTHQLSLPAASDSLAAAYTALYPSPPSPPSPSSLVAAATTALAPLASPSPRSAAFAAATAAAAAGLLLAAGHDSPAGTILSSLFTFVRRKDKAPFFAPHVQDAIAAAVAALPSAAASPPLPLYPPPLLAAAAAAFRAGDAPPPLTPTPSTLPLFFLPPSLPDLVTHLATVAALATGPPPTPWALAAAGSLARGSFAPCSDIDAVLLLAQPSPPASAWATAFATTLDLLLLSLGEDPLRLTDGYTPPRPAPGLRLDAGLLSPLRTAATPSALAARAAELTLAPVAPLSSPLAALAPGGDGVDPFAVALRTLAPLAGDDSLVAAFHADLDAAFASAATLTRAAALHLLAAHVADYSPLPPHAPRPPTLHVKHDLLRPLALAVDALALFFRLPPALTATHARIAALAHAEHIHPTLAAALSDALAAGTALRTSLHIIHGCEVDAVDATAPSAAPAAHAIAATLVPFYAMLAAFVAADGHPGALASAAPLTAAAWASSLAALAPPRPPTPPATPVPFVPLSDPYAGSYAYTLSSRLAHRLAALSLGASLTASALVWRRIDTVDAPLLFALAAKIVDASLFGDTIPHTDVVCISFPAAPPLYYAVTPLTDDPPLADLVRHPHHNLASSLAPPATARTLATALILGLDDDAGARVVVRHHSPSPPPPPDAPSTPPSLALTSPLSAAATTRPVLATILAECIDAAAPFPSAAASRLALCRPEDLLDQWIAAASVHDAVLAAWAGHGLAYTSSGYVPGVLEATYSALRRVVRAVAGSTPTSSPSPFSSSTVTLGEIVAAVASGRRVGGDGDAGPTDGVGFDAAVGRVRARVGTDVDAVAAAVGNSHLNKLGTVPPHLVPDVLRRVELGRMDASVQKSLMGVIGSLGVQELALFGSDVLSDADVTRALKRNEGLVALSLTSFSALTRPPPLTTLTPNLQWLALVDCRALTSLTLTRLDHVRGIDLSGCSALVSADIYLPNLTSLRLSGCDALTSLALSVPSPHPPPPLPPTITVDMSSWPALTPQHVASLLAAQWPRIASLVLTHSTAIPRGIRDAGSLLQHLDVLGVSPGGVARLVPRGSRAWSDVPTPPFAGVHHRALVVPAPDPAATTPLDPDAQLVVWDAGIWGVAPHHELWLVTWLDVRGAALASRPTAWAALLGVAAHGGPGLDVLVHIDVSFNGLDGAQLSALASALAPSSTLRSLVAAANAATPDDDLAGAVTLVRLAPALTLLDLSSMPLSPLVVDALAANARDAGASARGLAILATAAPS